MLKKQIVRIISSFLVGFLLCIQFSACAAEPSVELEEQLKLGMRYLSELDYENAVIAFSAAIEIDSKNARAYAGMYAVYIACSKIEKADEIWTTMLAKGVSADDVYGWVGRMADTISQAGDDGGKVQEAAALKVLSVTTSENDSKAVSETTSISESTFISAPPVTFVPWASAGLTDHEMDWGDEGLERQMRKWTKIETGPIMLSDVWEETVIYLLEDNITDISALSSCKNLMSLYIANNPIQDLTPLKSLTIAIQ